MSRRHLQFVSGSSAKFYEVITQANEVTVRFGRIGTDGQSQPKSFADNMAAAKHADKLLHQKLAAAA